MARVREILLPWDSQPQEAVDTDTSLDIGRDIEFGFVGSRSVGNFPRPVFGVHNGTQSVRTKDGIATLVDTVATSPNYQSFGVPSFTLGGPYSVAVRVNVTANSGPSYDRIFHCNYNASGNNRFGFFLTPASDGSPNRVYFDSTSSDGTRGIIGYSTSHSTYTANQFQTYLAVNDGTNLILYCPEGPVLSAALSSKFFGTLIGDLRIGLDQVGSDNGAPCEVSAAFIWSKAISPASAARFVQGNNYLEIFAPRTIPVPVSADGGGTSLTVADAAHAHTLDAVVLTSSTALVVQDMAHGHALDAATLSTGTALTVADSLHAHALDNVTLSTTGAVSLTVADSLHAHTLDAVVLTSQTDLAAADMAHGHALDGVTLTLGGISLVIAEIMHAHALDNVALTLDTYLAVADLLHAHTLDNVLVSIPGGTLDLILKILVNRQELNPATGTFTLYDDDATTVLYTTNAWADAAGTVPYSGGALRRIDALI